MVADMKSCKNVRMTLQHDDKYIAETQELAQLAVISAAVGVCKARLLAVNMLATLKHNFLTASIITITVHGKP